MKFIRHPKPIKTHHKNENQYRSLSVIIYEGELYRIDKQTKKKMKTFFDMPIEKLVFFVILHHTVVIDGEHKKF